ncbi:MAG: hypothetical protein LBM00_06125 [Deltaproteobacteria bacterium]|jgi:hypothetical protein|nr:hypothetical protein [Deltaproteobacteria bacterium]
MKNFSELIADVKILHEEIQNKTYEIEEHISLGQEEMEYIARKYISEEELETEEILFNEDTLSFFQKEREELRQKLDKTMADLSESLSKFEK